MRLNLHRPSTAERPARRGLWSSIAMAALLSALVACSTQKLDNAAGLPTGATAAARPDGWEAASHEKGAKANYDVVFPQDKVSEFQITIAPADWQAMLDDMTKLYGARGTGGGPGGQGPRPGANGGQAGNPRPTGTPGPRPSGSPGAAPNGAPDPAAGMPPGGMGGGFGGMNGSTEKPVWVPATIRFNGKTWTHVGVRFKGNSSLRSAWQGGTDKLPFKIDFDELDKEHPEIKNQRFYGFQQLSLSTNWNDAAYMRDAIAYDLLRDAGLPAAKTSFYEVVLDHGAGPTSLGLYTSVEVIDDTVVKRVFDGDKGNIYEAEGSAASLAANTFAQIQASFQKENNKDAADWSDVEKLHTVLNSEQRKTDPAGWRKGLEAVFDVDSFLHWLAIAAVLQHWDTYGGMTHNYYLYHDPKTDKLTWISWDHNLILGAQGGPGGGGMGVPGVAPGGDLPFPAPGVVPSGAPTLDPNGVPGGFPAMPNGGPGGGMGRNTSLDKKEVGENWPLIRYLLDQPDYYATYVKYLGETVHGPFDAQKMQTKYEGIANLLRPYAVKQNSGQAFDSALQSLIQVTKDRVKAVEDFLTSQTK